MAFALPRSRFTEPGISLTSPANPRPGSDPCKWHGADCPHGPRLPSTTCRGHPPDSDCYVEGWRVRELRTTGPWIDLHCRSFRCRRDRDATVGRVARRSAAAITSWAEPYLVTLTLRHLGQWPCPPCGSSKELQRAWNRLRGMIVRRYGPTVYLRVREWTSAGVGHYHVILDRAVDHTWLTYAWHRATQWSSWIVDSQAIIPGVGGYWGVADYIAGYLSKALSTAGREGNPSWKLAAHPKGLRRYGTSRGWSIFPRHVKGRCEVSTPNSRRSVRDGLRFRRPDRWGELNSGQVGRYCRRCRCRIALCVCADIGKRRRRPIS
jgi:hypothetical protein